MTKIDESDCENNSEDEAELERLRMLEEEKKAEEDSLAIKQLHLMEQDAIKGEIDNMLKSIVDSKAEELNKKEVVLNNKTSKP